MVKKRKQKEKSRGVAAMEDDMPSVVESVAVPNSTASGEGGNFLAPLFSSLCCVFASMMYSILLRRALALAAAAVWWNVMLAIE